MQIDGISVLMQNFKSETRINATTFKSSSGRTLFRTRESNPLSFSSSILLNFDDQAKARDFIDQIIAIDGPITMTLDQTDVNPFGDELPDSLLFFIDKAPDQSIVSYAQSMVNLSIRLDKSGLVYPNIFDPLIIDKLPYEWQWAEKRFIDYDVNENFDGVINTSNDDVSGRVIDLSFTLNESECIELRKFVFNNRYESFMYNSFVGDFAPNTAMRIVNQTFNYNSNIYKVKLRLEEL